MSYGLKIINPSNELVISSDAMGLYCVGKAVLQGAVVQPTGLATATFPGRKTGYSVYRINHPGQIIVALDLPLGKNVGLLGVTQPAAGVWEITAHCGDGPDADTFDTTEYALDVWAFGFAQSVAEGYGLALYTASGALAWDMSRANMLFPRAYVPSSLTVNNAIPSLARPVVIGVDSTNVTYDSFVSGSTYSVRSLRGAWKRNAAANITNTQYAKQIYRYLDVEPRGLNEGDIYPASGFILEGATLP